MIYWSIVGILLGIVLAFWRTWNDDNSVLRFVGICSGILFGIVLGPIMLLLFWEMRNIDKGQS